MSLSCAVLGDEIWPAAEHGRTMYTIRQRIGPLLMRMEKRYGKMESMTGELSEKEIIRQERNAGFISDRVREIQLHRITMKYINPKLGMREPGAIGSIFTCGKQAEGNGNSRGKER